MATLTSRREMERHQSRQKYMETATKQQMQQIQKEPSPPPASDRVQRSPPPAYNQSSYSPILRDNIYQHFTQPEQVIFERGLNDYEQRRNLVGFVECLRVILNTNQKRQLIFAIREYAIRSSDYKKFNKLLVNYGIAASVASTQSQPKPAMKKSDLATSGVHKIEIKKDPNGDWGFNIRGGSEHGVGIFVSWVNPGSDATSKGLKVGDQILKANDVNFEGISHQAAVQIMSSVKKLRLFVLSKGIVPHTQVNPQQSFVWVDVNGQSCTPPMTRHGRRGFQSEADERKITLVVEPGKQLGISIRGGSEHGLGIYITGVDDGSVADTYGLKAGDQILEVNGTSFIRILHSEAAKILKTNTMLIMVVKDVGKLPHSRATTQTQWHSSQPANSVSANRMRHFSDEKSGFKQDIGKQVMHDRYSGHPSLTIMKGKAKSVLSESEWKTFNYYITQYKQHKLQVEDLAIALIDLLDTTEKYKLIAEVRSIIFPKDMNTFNKLTVHKEMLTRKGRYDFQEATKFGGSENSLTSSDGSQDSITQNARAILDNFTLQSRDSDSEESDDEGFGGGIQLKSYVQNSSNDSVITPERYGSNMPDKSKTDTPKFFAPPPPSTPPNTSTPQSDNLQDILTDTLKERRKQLQPKDSFMDSSQDDTLNASCTFNASKDAPPHIVVTGSQESLSAVIQESMRREREEKIIREQREKERRIQEAREKHRMESDREPPHNLEDKIEEIEARIKKEYEVALRKEREKLAELQKQEIERREELDRLENERKRQSRANFQESVRIELESEIRQEYEKSLQVEKEEKEQLQFILAQQKINEEAITELETKIREDVQRQAREQFELVLQKEREEMQKREEAERKRREEIEEAQKRMEIERLEAEEQMRIEIEERVAKEAEERARLEYEERLQRETAERARLAEEIKTHKEIEQRLEQQIQQQKEEMERQIALEKERAEELIEQERLARAAENEAAEQAINQKQKEEQRREREAAEQKRRDEEQKKREQEAAEQKRREEEQRKREREAAEQNRREEEQRKREREAAEQNRREEEQRKREQEATEQKRKEEEQRRQEQEAAEQKRREEQREREREAVEQKQREEEQRRLEQEAAEQKRKRKREEEEVEQKRREQEIEDQQLEQLLLLDTNDFGKKKNTTQSFDKETAVQEDRERAEKMLQQRMLMSKQKGASKGTSASKEGGMSYAKQASVVSKKGFSYAGYSGLTGDLVTVTITKVTKRLGIAVNGGAETKQVAVKIKEIIAGESAALTGQGLRVGQQILQVNNTSMKGLRHKEAVLAIKNAFTNAEKTMSIVVLDPDDDD